MTLTLAPEQARRIAVRAQLLDARRPVSLVATVDQLTLLQIDPTKVQATFEHGVLDLVLPKADQVKPRTIKVNAK